MSETMKQFRERMALKAGAVVDASACRSCGSVTAHRRGCTAFIATHPAIVKFIQTKREEKRNDAAK